MVPQLRRVVAGTSQHTQTLPPMKKTASKHVYSIFGHICRYKSSHATKTRIAAQNNNGHRLPGPQSTR